MADITFAKHLNFQLSTDIFAIYVFSKEAKWN